MKNKFILLVCVLWAFTNFGQEKNKLINLLEKAKKTKSIDSTIFYLKVGGDLIKHIDKREEVILKYYGGLADLERKKSNFNRSDSILKLSNKLTFKTFSNGFYHRINNKLDLIVNQFQTGKFLPALELLSKVKDSIELLKNNNKYEHLLHRFKESKAIVLANLGEIKKAEKLFLWNYNYVKRKLAKTKSDKNIKEYSGAINNLALCYEYLNKTNEAINLYHEAITISEKNELEEMNLILKNNISRLFFYNQEYSKVLEICNPILENNKYPKHNLNTLLYVAHAYFNLDSLSISKKLYLKGLRKSKSIGLFQEQMNTEGNLGTVYFRLNKLDSAFLFLKKAKKKFLKSKVKAELGKVYSTLGMSYLKINNIPLAKKNLLLADIEFNKTTDNERAKYRNELALSKLYKRKLDYKKSLEWLEKKDSTQKAYTKIRSNSEIRKIEAKFQTQQKENQILRLKNEAQEKELVIQKSKIKTNYALAGIFLVVLGSGMYLRKRKKDQKLEILEESVKSIEQEKIRIGKELHDGIASNLRLLAHDTETKDINLSHKLLDSYTEIRNLSHQLNNTPIHGEPFMDRIYEIVPKNKENQVFELKIEPPYLELIEPYSTHLFRITQELLTNNLKYAKASKTKIEVNLENNSLTLKYSDNGVGSSDFKKGNGLKSVEDRVILLNGTLAISSEKGFSVSIQIPYKK